MVARRSGRRFGWTPLVAIAAVGTAIPLVLTPVASASGAVTQTSHFSSVQQWGTPTGTPTNNSNCTGPTGSALINDFVFIDDVGNGVQHFTMNAAGDGWFTTTFTGTGHITFYPPSSLDVVFDKQGNIVGTPTIKGPADFVFSGKLTEWFGFEANKQNAVGHGTVNAIGVILGSGTPLSFHDVVQFRWAQGANQSGPPTSFSNRVTC